MEELLDRVSAHGPYGYRPHLVPAIVFLVVYAIAAAAHIFLGVKHLKQGRLWLPTLAFGCVVEAAAMALRVLGHYQPTNINAYIAQQVMSVLTPAFFAAAHFSVGGLALVLFGAAYAPRKVAPRRILPFFVTVDVLSLILQGTGSGMAAVAEQQEPPQSTFTGAWIVVGGLIIQLMGYLAFNALAVVFLLRVRRAPPTSPHWTPRFRLFLLAVWLSSLLVLLRSAFRTAEMLKGWIGPIATVEVWFYCLDALPVSLAVLILVPFYPARFLPDDIRLGAHCTNDEELGAVDELKGTSSAPLSPAAASRPLSRHSSAS